MRSHNTYSTKDHFGIVEQGETSMLKSYPTPCRVQRRKYTMKQKTQRLVLVSLVVSALFLSSIPTIMADSQNVTVRWIVPADTTIAVSYPSGESNVVFEPSGKTFTDEPAKSQTGSNAALRITNNGNTAVSINASFSTDLPTGITFVNVSVGDNTNSTLYWYVPANDTDDQELDDSIAAAGGTQDFWFWSSGTDVAEGTVDKTFTVTSSNTS